MPREQNVNGIKTHFSKVNSQDSDITKDSLNDSVSQYDEQILLDLDISVIQSNNNR